MANNKVDIDHIAKLARLELTDAEKAQFTREISDILKYVEQLQELDVNGVEPTAHASRITNVIREDIPGNCQNLADTMRNAPEVLDDQLIKVHAVLDTDGGGA
jgi:aspartyl-tRNA(Asn)/glutamyl-tRNA(Gln) amidotransferase subunit C